MKMLASFRRFADDRSGASAVEFALGAPVLLLGLIIVTDLGLAVNERMNLDQSLRQGAQFAMGDVSSETDLEKLVSAASTGSYGEQQGDVTNSDAPIVDVTRSCACPDAPTVEVACTTVCTGDLPPSIYYDFTAQKTHAAIFLPDMTLKSSITVQVR